MAKRKIGKMKIVYDKEKDEFQLWSKLNGQDEYGFVIGCKCVYSAGHENEYVPGYIYWEILARLRRFAVEGYELVEEGNNV